jgi:hypothetical protein
MPSRSSKPRDHDFTTVARRVVEQAIGEKLDGTPLDNPHAGKNPAAVALGKLGGAKGGAARAAALSPAKRTAIAKKAANLKPAGETVKPIFPQVYHHLCAVGEKTLV